MPDPFAYNMFRILDDKVLLRAKKSGSSKYTTARAVQTRAFDIFTNNGMEKMNCLGQNRGYSSRTVLPTASTSTYFHRGVAAGEHVDAEKTVNPIMH